MPPAHLVEPVVLTEVPGVQAEHVLLEAAAVLVLYVPAAQGVHAAEPLALAKVPAGQAMQEAEAVGQWKYHC